MFRSLHLFIMSVPRSHPDIWSIPVHFLYTAPLSANSFAEATHELSADRSRKIRFHDRLLTGFRK